ncbi:AAA family ATPase [Bernardetia sp. OM2101]|uniref:AAA family ATPase n=1 Tax=Bernardetia sp. OM2101 TaxID=3344876 RepID=UPI0035CF97D5
MDEEKISAAGERAAIGGYLPQFNEFASFVYINIVNRQLEWIKVADPEAEKLDDIQYSTFSEIHAYQVKWTINKEKISYKGFVELMPLLISSWKKIKNNNLGKKVVPHLLTNKQLSSNDKVGKGLGSFDSFIDEVWNKLKIDKKIDNKWNPVVKELKKNLNISDSEFVEFVRCFEFQPNHKQKGFNIKSARHDKEHDDLQRLSSFLIESVASPDRPVRFTRKQIIENLGWADRFRTTFNHELIIERKKYQPINSTIDSMNSSLSQFESGYLFLVGSPGSGKSTLLNQWSKDLEIPFVKYYAFDFVNPSSTHNFYERGNSVSLFFDLVIQIQSLSICSIDVLPYKEIVFLKNTFAKQLIELSNHYKKTGEKVVIIIDGLDHVPREYKDVIHSFLRELPLSSELPKGIFIILGSQSYDLVDIPLEIQKEAKNDNRKIKISPFTKQEVYNYIDNFDFCRSLEQSQKLDIFHKSQGHPLYLSVILDQIETTNLPSLIDSFSIVNSDIDNYYEKIWKPIEQNEKLIELIGLVTRVNGLINLAFIEEWNFEREIIRLFMKQVVPLFSKTENFLSFFHNSFKQFLLNKTALNYFEEKFDPKLDKIYHARLAQFYKESKVEKYWKQNYHLFEAKKYNNFLKEANPEKLLDNIIDFRPLEEVKQEIRLAIKISKVDRNISLLIRCLLFLTEVERRDYYLSNISFIEEFLKLGNIDLAKEHLRSGTKLYVDEKNAMMLVQLFLDYHYTSEANLFFNLAYPKYIHYKSIIIKESDRYREAQEHLIEWGKVVSHFLDIDSIIEISRNTIFQGEIFDSHYEEKKEYIIFNLLYQAIDECLFIKNNDKAVCYLSKMKNEVEHTTSINKIYIASVVYRVTKNEKEALSWIKDVKQPSTVDGKNIRYMQSFSEFHPLIIYNRVLNKCGNRVEITEAIPSVEKDSDEEVIVEFERMICLMVQLESKELSDETKSNIIRRIIPVVRFYYKDLSHRNQHWNNIKRVQEEYFTFFIKSIVSKLEIEQIEEVANFIFKEFVDTPEHWIMNTKRIIISSLVDIGYNKEEARKQLEFIEPSMREDYEIVDRVQDFKSQAKAYFDIKEYERGKFWLKEVLKNSIGVGYKKDYQFSNWIDWLKKINKKQPLSAIGRIKWFLSHLEYIKNTTRGRAYWNASKELLETTYELNFYAGFIQSKWQLEKGLVSFEDSIELFIEYYIKQIKNREEFVSILKLYKTLYFSIVEHPYSLLLEQILNKGYELFGNKFIEKYLSDIILKINTKVFEKDRNRLLSIINDFLSSNEINSENYYSKLELEEESQNSYPSNLTLKNDDEITEKELFERITSYEEFKEIIIQEQNTSHFNWLPFIKKISSTITLPQLEEIVKLVKGKNKEAELYCELSQIALQLNNKQLATDLANTSLNLSESSGWIKYYDGGTRINAFKALKNIDANLHEEKAFDVFSNDILNSSYSASYSEYLEEIIPLLDDNYNVEEVWNEINDYLKRLMINSNPITDLPNIEVTSKPILNTLVDYINYFLNHPVLVIQEQTRMLISDYITQNNEYALSKVIDNQIDNYATIDILMYLAEKESKQLYKLKDNLFKFSLSKDYHIRKNARNLLLQIGEAAHTNQSIDLQIPFTFFDKSNEEVENLLRVFHPLINTLSYLTGIYEDDIYEKVYSIMKEIENLNEWTEEHLEELNYQLKEVNLGYSHLKPVVITARKAIMYVVSELIDSGHLDESRNKEIFQTYDYSVDISPVISKPSFIQTLREGNFGGVNKNWLDRINQSPRLAESLQKFNNMKVIGEYTMVKNLDWGTPTEEYISCISTSEDENDSYFIFGLLFQSFTEDYYKIQEEENHIVIIRDHLFERQLNVKSRWIAINPMIAKKLGWKPCKSKLFAWQNAEGEIMTESIYWSNGNSIMRPRKDGETGEGWFVIVSEKAWIQIKSLQKGLFIQKKLTRLLYKNPTLDKRQVFSVRAI